jgi:RNA polymerase sigma-70 factor (ECF subfamily)
MPEFPPRSHLPDPSVSSDEAGERPSTTPRSFRSVYDDHFDFVWRFAVSRRVPASALDEVVHEVFLAVHRRLSGFEVRSELRIGIASVARYVVQRYVRPRAAQSPMEPLVKDELSPGDEQDAADALHEKSAGQLLDIILDKMSESEREAFILRDMEGLSMSETAEALGVNENTLRIWLHDARKVFNSAAALLRAQRFWVTREGGNPP